MLIGAGEGELLPAFVEKLNHKQTLFPILRNASGSLSSKVWEC